MSVLRSFVACGGLLLVAGVATAQVHHDRAAAMAGSAATAGPAATTVQLPTFQFFTVNTTVWAPDGGSVSLGGMGGSAAGTGQGFGLFPGRATASSMSSAKMSMSVKIHDMNKLDAAVLANARGTSPTAPASAAAAPPQPSSAAVGSLSEARRQVAAEQAQVERQAVDYFTQAQLAEADGQLGTAKIYYQMAERRAVEPLRSQIAARRRALAERTSQAAAPRAGAR